MDQYPVVYVIQRMEFLKMSRNALIFSGNPIMGIDSLGVKRELSGNVVVSMNVWAFSDVFNYLERSFSDFLGSLSDPINQEFYLPSAVDQMD